jgi:hypothetical protein
VDQYRDATSDQAQRKSHGPGRAAALILRDDGDEPGSHPGSYLLPSLGIVNIAAAGTIMGEEHVPEQASGCIPGETRLRRWTIGPGIRMIPP